MWTWIDDIKPTLKWKAKIEIKNNHMKISHNGMLYSYYTPTFEIMIQALQSHYELYKNEIEMED